jgi:hypothetical protein
VRLGGEGIMMHLLMYNNNPLLGCCHLCIETGIREVVWIAALPITMITFLVWH